MEDFVPHLQAVEAENWGYNSRLTWVITKLSESKTVWIENLRLLWLPHYKMCSCKLVDFLRSPEETVKLLECNLYYIILVPQASWLKRMSDYWKDINGIIASVKQRVSEEDSSKYEIIIQQFFPNRYWWNVIIRQDWSVLVEFGAWPRSQSNITKGRLPLDEIYIVRKDIWDASFQYNFQDNNLRNLIRSVLRYIPCNDWIFISGYFEFIIWDYNWTERIIFIDARTNEWYII